jgi:peptidase M28-like protein
LARTPRITGSPEAAQARSYCASELEALGFTVVVRTFTYSQFPARFATPCFGLWCILTLWLTAKLGSTGLARASLALSVISIVVLVGGGIWLARRGVTSFPALRREGVNLEATRGKAGPGIWLVAHSDSKSQLVPMLGRVISVVLLSLSWIAMLLLGLISLVGAEPSTARVWDIVAGLGILGGAGIAATIVGNRSAGAVDNASGVAVVLAVLEALPRDIPLGVLITDAEEMGLAGARAAAGVMPPAIAINVDGVDDDGTVMSMYSGAPPQRLLNLLTEASGALGEPLVARRLIPGVLVDGIALADAGWTVVTLSRGTARTLRRIHTKADNLHEMTGAGIPIVARIVSRIVQELS